MKRDLAEMESDDGLNAPPYVTRCTKPREGHLINDPEWWAGYNAIVKHEFAAKFNNQMAEVFDA